MPLKENTKPGSPGFGENIATEIKAGKPPKQAEAIANAKARGDVAEMRADAVRVSSSSRKEYEWVEKQKQELKEIEARVKRNDPHLGDEERAKELRHRIKGMGARPDSIFARVDALLARCDAKLDARVDALEPSPHGRISAAQQKHALGLDARIDALCARADGFKDLENKHHLENQTGPVNRMRALREAEAKGVTLRFNSKTGRYQEDERSKPLRYK